MISFEKFVILSLVIQEIFSSSVTSQWSFIRKWSWKYSGNLFGRLHWNLWLKPKYITIIQKWCKHLMAKSFYWSLHPSFDSRKCIFKPFWWWIWRSLSRTCLLNWKLSNYFEINRTALLATINRYETRENV